MAGKVHIHYNKTKSVRAIAETSGVSEDAVRKYIQKTGVSRSHDNAVNRIDTIRKAIAKLRQNNAEVTLTGLKRICGYDTKTIRKYMPYAMGEISTEKVPKVPLSKSVIKSISNNQQKILADILRLHSYNKEIDADLTYSVGGFYKNCNYLCEPRMKYDMFPQASDVAALREVERIETGGLYTVVCDPPFTVSQGPSLTETGRTTLEGSNMTSSRFGCFSSIKEMENSFSYLLEQSYRILKQKNGILIFKIQPTVTSGKQYFANLFVCNTAIQLGFELVDEFILIGNRRILSSKHSNQQHARKYHSYFYVFRKR